MNGKAIIPASPREIKDGPKNVEQITRSKVTRNSGMVIHCFLESVLNVLPSYLDVRWASIVDTSGNNVVSIHPEHNTIVDIQENVAAIKSLLMKSGDLKIKTCVRYENDHGFFLYSAIDDRYALIVNLPPDTPYIPAEMVCDHVMLVLRKLLEMNYGEVISLSDAITLVELAR